MGRGKNIQLHTLGMLSEIKRSTKQRSEHLVWVHWVGKEGELHMPTRKGRWVLSDLIPVGVAHGRVSTTTLHDIEGSCTSSLLHVGVEAEHITLPVT